MIAFKVLLSAVLIIGGLALFLWNPLKQFEMHHAVRTILRYTALIFTTIIPLEYIWGQKNRIPFSYSWLNDYLHLVKNLPTAIIIGAFSFVGLSHRSELMEYVNSGFTVWVSELPFAVQLLLLLLIVDFYSYWIHRMSHRIELFWYSHAVHHSIVKMDYVAGYRNHIFEQAFFRMGLAFIFSLFGFSYNVVLWTMLIVPLNNTLQHINIRFRIRFLEKIIVTPFYHYWHHEIKSGNHTNYANMFPVYDIIFGTYHLPEHWPEELGIEGHPVSQSFFLQMIHPFKYWPMLYRRHFRKKEKIDINSLITLPDKPVEKKPPSLVQRV